VTPKWMISKDQAAALPSAAQGGKRGRRSFLEKTLWQLALVMQESVFSETYASAPGLLQGLDPRVKFATLILFLIVTSLVRSIPVLVSIYLFTLLLAQLSHIRPSLLHQARLVVHPPFRRGHRPSRNLECDHAGRSLGSSHLPPPCLFVGPYHIPEVIGISRAGVMGPWCSSAGWRLRSLSGARHLDHTLDRLMKALRVVRIPQVFVLTLGMTYRYILLLVQTGAGDVLGQEEPDPSLFRRQGGTRGGSPPEWEPCSAGRCR